MPAGIESEGALMVTSGICPDPRTLELLLLGRLSLMEIDQLEAHLHQCPRCAAAAAVAVPSDSFVLAVQSLCISDEKTVTGIPSGSTMPPSSAVSEATVMQGPEEVSAAGSEPTVQGAATMLNPSSEFDFLRPPEEPGEMGRLGTYRVIQLLGAGGMGAVFLAEDPVLRRQVALKVINRETAKRKDAIARFLREAQATAKLEHDNIVAIYQAAEDQGVPYIAMPLLKGKSLEDCLRQVKGALSIDETLRIGREIAAGLAAAHAKGLIHRDIKPANIWIEESGRAKLLDFGLARALSNEDGNLSHPEAIVGTPAYMAPEQAQAEDVDGRADLFSLGCVMYRMATGKQPFQGSNLMATLLSVVNDEPPEPVTVNPQVPKELTQLIRKLMAKLRDNRYPDANAAIAAIRALELKRNPPKVVVRHATRWLWAAVAVVLLTLIPVAYFTGPVIHRYTTDQGEVVIETDDADVEIKVSKNGEQIEIIDTKTKKTFLLKSGTYEFEIVGGDPGLKLSSSSFTLERGGKRIVTVTKAALGEVCFFGDVSKGKVTLKLNDREFPAVTLKEGAAITVPTGTYTMTLTNADTNVKLATTTVQVDAARKQMVEVYRIGERGEWPESPGRIWTIALSPDDRLALAGGGGIHPDMGMFDPTVGCMARLSETATGKEKRAVAMPVIVRCVAFNKDGKRFLMSDNEGRMQVQEVGGDKVWSKQVSKDQAIWAAAFSPDSRHILCGDAKGVLRLLDATTGDVVADWKEIKHTKGSIRGVAFTRDGKRAITVAEDGRGLVWDTQTWKIDSQFLDHGTTAIKALALTDDAAITGDEEGNVMIWDPRGGKKPTYWKDLLSVKEPIQGIAVSENGRQAVLVTAHWLVFWDVKTGKVLQRFEWKGKPLTCVALSKSGHVAYTGGIESKVRVWGLPRE